MSIQTQETISAPEIMFSFILLGAAAIYPNAYVLAGIGMLHLGSIALTVLLPTVAAVFAIWFYARTSGMRTLSRAIVVALLAGILGTIALDAIRLPSVFAGFLPMDEAREIATDLLPAQQKNVTPMSAANASAPMDDNMAKPRKGANSTMRNSMNIPTLTPFQALLGYLYHYGNGVSFALVFVILFGRVRWWVAVLYAVFFVDAGMMLAMPLMMKMNLPAPGWIAALLAHVAYGTVLGVLGWRLLVGPGLLARLGGQFFPSSRGASR